MVSTIKTGLVLVAGLTAAAMPCPLCSVGAGPVAAATPPPVHGSIADTAQVRLHISGMTCGTCPTTAHLALQKVSGVYSATVTLDDSLGVVRYDPRRVTPAQIVSHLTRLTGYVATELPDSTATPRKSGGA